MRIGLFDSGVGGLVIAKSVFKLLPKHDFLFLGDTQRVPYGNRDQKTIYTYTRQAVEFLFKQDCKLVVLACNTVSAMALRKLQQEWLFKNYPDRKVLGIIVPTMEVVAQNKNIKSLGVLATQSTVNSHIYKKELKKIRPDIVISEVSAPLLVPMVENDAKKEAVPVLKKYLKPFLKSKVDALVLGCTHYPILLKEVKHILGTKVKVISQTEIVPKKLTSYLKKHSEIEKKLTKKSIREFLVTKTTPELSKIAQKLFGKKIIFKQVKIS